MWLMIQLFASLATLILFSLTLTRGPGRVMRHLDAGAVTSFIPELWAREILSKLRRSNVYASPQVVNRNYQGEIQQAGDTVHITSLNDPTIGDYTGPGTVVWEELTTTDQMLLITEQKFFAFEIDDVDAAQVADDGRLMAEGMAAAGARLAETQDTFVAGLYTGADAGNDLGTVGITTPALADDLLVDLMVLLDDDNVPRDGRYVIVPNWLHGLLVKSDTFLADKAGDAGSARNGMVGTARGFQVLTSPATPNPIGDDFVVMAGHNIAITLADQIPANRVRAVEREDSFSDGVKGLHVYGAKVVRPTALAVATASQT